MSVRVCVLDPSRSEGFSRWEPADGRVVVMGHQAGPGALPALRDAECVLLMHRPQDAPRAAYLGNVLTGALPHLRLVRAPLGASLLAAAVVGSEATMGDDEPDSVVVTRVVRTLAPMVSGAWVQRVTRLSDPSPRFAQHVRSLFPGPGFVALLGPEPRVVAAAPAGGVGSPRPRVLVGADPASNAYRGIERWLGDADIVDVQPVAESVRAVYGNDGAELVVMVDRLAPAPSSSGDCRVCRQPVHDQACMFCHVLIHPEVVLS